MGKLSSGKLSSVERKLSSVELLEATFSVPAVVPAVAPVTVPAVAPVVDLALILD